MIKNRQIAYITDDIVKSSLSAGAVPTYGDIVSERNKKIKEVGKPMLSVNTIEPFSVSNSNILNEMFSSIEKDIIISLDEDISNYNKMLSLFNYYELEKRKAINITEEHNSRLEAIKKYKSFLKYGNILGERINTFNNIEFNGSGPVPSTTGFINLRRQMISNWNTRHKMLLDNASYTISTLSDNIVSVVDVYPLSNAFDNVLSDMWLTRVVSKDTSAKIEIEITLKDVTTINSIMYTMPISKAAILTLYLSANGTSYVENSTITPSSGTVEWNFSEQAIKSFKIVIEKPEPDGVNGKYNEFYFNADNISLYKTIYKDQQVFTTTPYKITNASKVALVTKQYVYPNSNIKYHLIFEDIVNGTMIKSIEPVINNDFDTYFIDAPTQNYTGTVRLTAMFNNGEHSPQLYIYKLLVQGVEG